MSTFGITTLSGGGVGGQRDEPKIDPKLSLGAESYVTTT